MLSPNCSQGTSSRSIAGKVSARHFQTRVTDVARVVVWTLIGMNQKVGLIWIDARKYLIYFVADSESACQPWYKIEGMTTSFAYLEEAHTDFKSIAHY